MLRTKSFRRFWAMIFLLIRKQTTKVVLVTMPGVIKCSDLLPSGFAAANGLPYEKGKKSVEGPKAVIKVGTDTAAESGFATGQRLELVTETQDGRIGVSIANITGVKCHLLVVKPSCDRSDD